MAAVGTSLILVSLVLRSLFVIVVGSDETDNHVRSLSYPDFETFIEDSHVRIVYFKRRVEPLNVKSFLQEYDKAAQTLASYGIQLGLVECSEAPPGIPHCPNDETAERFAHGFRESVEKIALPLETLYDVNSIVSSALHLALIHNVPIVQRQSERKELEDHCKLKCNIIYTFQRVLGTYEHRVFMEAAHQFFDRYIFAMTTTESATRGLTTIDSDGEPSAILEEPAVWVLLCQHVSDVTKECLHTNYRNPMDLQNFISFLEHLELPDWIELSIQENPTGNIYESHNLNTIFLVYDSGTREKITDLAPELGLRFKGIAGVVVLNINEFSPERMLQMGFQPDNLKPPAIGFKAHGQAKVTVINEYDNAYQFIVDQLKFLYGSQDLHQNVFELVEELDELQQDDELALALQSAGRDSYLHDSVLPPLTDKSFHTFIRSEPVVAVLFYLHWDPASIIALDVFSKTAAILESAKSAVAALGRVDCFDWTDVCDQENITTYPTTKVFHEGVRMNFHPQVHEPTALLTSLVLCGLENPTSINANEEIKSFISGELLLPGSQSVVVPTILLGKEKQNDVLGDIFKSIGRDFHGLVRMATCDEHSCDQISRTFNVDVTFVITFKPYDVFENYIILKDSLTAESVKVFVEESCLERFPLLTEHNFAAYRKEDKPLALLFVQSGQHQDAYMTMGNIAARNKHMRFAWMDLWNNVTQSIKNELLPESSDEELTLAVVDYKKAYVFVYSGDFQEKLNIQNWIDDLSNGIIEPLKTLSSGEWKPRLPGFDYLKFIDDDQVRGGEEMFIMDSALDELDTLHQSRLFRLPGSSDKRVRMKSRDETETEAHHQHYEL